MSRTWGATFATEVYRRTYGADGEAWAEKVCRELEYKPNLRTNDGIDWQSGMGGHPSETGSFLSGTATATSATSLTATGTPFPVTGGYGNTTTSPLASMIVVALTTGVWGVIITNTSGGLVIDKWYSPTAIGGAAATTPSGTTAYVILPAMVPSWWMALTADATGPSATDHTLASEITTNGLGAALGAFAHTNGTNTVTVSNLFTATGGTTTINKEAIGNASTTSRIMTFESAEPSPPTLIASDTLNQSVVVTY